MVDLRKIDKFWNFFVSNKSEFENSTEHDAAEKLNFLLENLISKYFKYYLKIEYILNLARIIAVSVL